MEKQGLGKWAFTPDPYEMAELIIDHIDQKRRALGIDRGKERVFVDMAARRELQAG
jgi:carbon-monoxide dehydrogenase catalytic subunit